VFEPVKMMLGGRVIVAHAHELQNDGVGNDDGLCEPGERCVVLRNAGAYQGSNLPVHLGTLGDIELLAYPTP
jgi:hypothetical protein